MAGDYLKNKAKCLNYLNIWKNTVIKGKLWETFADLHIDEVSKEFKKPVYWIDGGLYLYDCLLELIDRKVYECILCIPLVDSNNPTCIKDINILFLEKSMDLTPSSLYLFPIGHYDYNQTIKESIFLQHLSQELDRKAYFKEDLDGNVYSRAIFIRS